MSAYPLSKLPLSCLPAPIAARLRSAAIYSLLLTSTCRQKLTDRLVGRNSSSLAMGLRTRSSPLGPRCADDHFARNPFLAGNRRAQHQHTST
eukprot:6190946-Pleurochrysis_carterae.AAC.4